MLCKVYYVAVMVVCAEWFELKVSVGDVLTLIGIVVALIEFGVSSRKSRKQTLKNQKETWFLNVIVLPQLEGINNIYQRIIENLIIDKDSIKDYRKKDFDSCNYYVAELKRQRKQEINDFFDHVIALVLSYDDNLGRDVSTIVMGLEDIYVEIIDCFVKDVEVENIRGEVLQNKQQLIAKLNTGLKNG